MTTIELIRHADQTTTEWAGGTTTQLAIHPPGASYAERAFAWRLSTASVDLPESRFTPLPGFRRILMLLSGEMLLRHEGHHEQRLRAFEQDRFDGAWNTTSFGRAVDFNLMMAQGIKGDIAALTLAPDREAVVPAAGAPEHGRCRTIALYACAGGAEVHLGGQSYLLAEKDLLLLHETPAAAPSGEPLRLHSATHARIIRTVVLY